MWLLPPFIQPQKEADWTSMFEIHDRRPDSQAGACPFPFSLSDEA
jgi:hypothetical protein